KQGEDANSNTNTAQPTAAILGANGQPLEGNVLYSAPQYDLNPRQSMITFNGNNLLLAPDHDLSVSTNLANLQVDAGAAVMLIQSEGQLAVYALHDDYSGAVTVTVQGQSMEIPVGRQLILTNDLNSNFDKVNPSAIGYRDLSDGKMGSLKAYI